MKSHTTSFWWVAFACSVCCAWGHTQVHAVETTQSDYVVADVAFKAHDGVEMFGRLVLPKSNAPRAVVIYVQTAEGATIDMKRPLGKVSLGALKPATYGRVKTSQ